MPYVRKIAGREVITGLAVILHIMRVDKCDHRRAIQQIERATRDDSSWWWQPNNVGGRVWGPSAEHFQDEVLNRWPEPDAKATSAKTASSESATAEASGKAPGRRGSNDDIKSAVQRCVAADRDAGRNPHINRTVEAVLGDYPDAGRDRVREFYTAVVRQKRGRPRKSREKIAE